MQTFSTTASVKFHRDTRSWHFQAWASFAIAVGVCGMGLSWLPGEALDRAFMVMGYVFCLSAVFMLSKFVRDGDQAEQSGTTSTDVPMWRMVVWGSFVVAMGLTGWGLMRMGVNETYKAFLGVSWLFLISSAFTLAKTLRDRHEVDIAEGHKPASFMNRTDGAVE